MNKLISIVIVMLSAGFVNASENLVSEPSTEVWICEAAGKQSFGGPVGDIWTRVQASGDTESEASSAAFQKCFGRGLNQCMVTGCILAD